VSLLNFAVLSTVADFPTVCSGGPTADDIHDVPIVPAAAAVIFDLELASLHAGSLLLQASQLLLTSIGGPVVAFIPAVACVPTVVSSHNIAVILAVIVAGVTVVACVTAVACVQSVAGILAVFGVF
jgi:hypothetical protein